MDNILVVGGTGMLSKATQWLNTRGSRLTIIARNEEKLGKVSECCEYPENNTIISLDYQDSDKLQNSIQEEQKKYGNYNMIVAWIHSTAPNALRIIIDEIANAQKPYKLFHILGSNSDVKEIQKRLCVPAECSYRQIQLGKTLYFRRMRKVKDELTLVVVNRWSIHWFFAVSKNGWCNKILARNYSTWSKCLDSYKE